MQSEQERTLVHLYTEALVVTGDLKGYCDFQNKECTNDWIYSYSDRLYCCLTNQDEGS